MRASRLLVVIVALAVVGGACTTSRTLDGGQLEADIGAQLLPDYPGAIRSISCPDTPDPLPGADVLCLATIGDQVLDVRVELGGTDDELTSSAIVDGRFVAINEVAALLSATFGDEIGIVTSVDCGQPVIVLAEDEPVRCDATDPRGVVRVFDVRIDNDGLVEFSLR